MAKWYEKGPSGWITGLTDMIGLTDSHAPGRAASAAASGMGAANSQFDTDMAPQLQLWEAAMDGRGLGDNLDRFDDTMQGAMAGTMARPCTRRRWQLRQRAELPQPEDGRDAPRHFAGHAGERGKRTPEFGYQQEHRGCGRKTGGADVGYGFQSGTRRLLAQLAGKPAVRAVR